MEASNNLNITCKKFSVLVTDVTRVFWTHCDMLRVLQLIPYRRLCSEFKLIYNILSTKIARPQNLDMLVTRTILE